MKKKALLWLLPLAMTSSAWAARHDHSEARAFAQQSPCPSSGQAEKRCPGWAIDYLVPLCNGGNDTRDNMRWVPTEEKRLIKAANGKDCKNLLRDRPGLPPLK